MQNAWVPGTLPLIFGLFSSLQGVSTKEAINTPVAETPAPFSLLNLESCRILFVIFLAMVPLLCIWGLVRCFCPSCRELQHDFRTADHHIPPEPPSIAPLESIWVTSLGPPPSYSQVVLNSTPTEPPPPYSLRPKGPADQMGGHAYATL
ncbi:transmembrane protein 92-like [Mastomys coucha]|uniref:transmembrane protein 92-like n=1 Tax=Mastomys coucha TaxID=35658 RepID=UPI00126269BD|nr:transmembrane protein 92-like [Mastomys coucha]